MKLLLFHPGVASIRCEECKRWIYKLETGERETYESGPDRRKLPCGRPPNVPTPCGECPKGSPEREADFRLSGKNIRMLNLYFETKAAGGIWTEAEREDELLRANLVSVDALWRRANEDRGRRLLAVELANQLAAVVLRR